MNIFIALLLSTLAGFGTLFGSLLIFMPNCNKSSSKCLILAFSGTTMILISILDLLPSSIFTILKEFSLLKSILIILFTFILGIIIINTLDKHIEKEDNLYKIGILSLISLMIHNFPEGIATFLTSMINVNVGIKLTIAILLHNIPEGICIALPIYLATKSYKKAFSYSFLASIAEPLGALCAYIFLKDYMNVATTSIILIFVASLMITLSINHIYKESLNLNNKKAFLIGVISASIYIIISLIL